MLTLFRKLQLILKKLHLVKLKDLKEISYNSFIVKLQER